MDDQPPPPPTKLTFEQSLERLRDNDGFRVVIQELRDLREEQFGALKEAKKRTVFEIVGAVSVLDDLIATFEGGG